MLPSLLRKKYKMDFFKSKKIRVALQQKVCNHFGCYIVNFAELFHFTHFNDKNSCYTKIKMPLDQMKKILEQR